jgi:hypothetical protein
MVEDIKEIVAVVVEDITEVLTVVLKAVTEVVEVVVGNIFRGGSGGRVGSYRGVSGDGGGY